MTSHKKRLVERVESSLAANDMRQAITACRELNTSYPDDFPGWFLAGEVHRRMGKPEALLISTAKAESLRPGDPGIALQRIEAFIALDDIAAARELLLGFDNDASLSAEIHDRVGRHMASLDLHEPALRQYRKALQFDPDNPGLLYNVATALRFLGASGEAVEMLDRMLAIEPLDFEAQAMRSSLEKQTATANHVEELEGLLVNPNLKPNGVTSICYALAKEYDDLDQPAQSFRFLQRGADHRRAHMSYDVATDIEIIDALIAVCNEDFFATPVPGDPSAEPIFIVGMPRTGTTLVERILASHPEVYAAGELDNFGRVLMQQFKARGVAADTRRAPLIAQSTTLDFAALGRAYVDSTRPMTADRPHFIDKLPFNYLYVGLIHRALPNARIINLVRHPMATCYSVYKQLFRDPYPFSYDLDDLGRYYVAYRRLMDHWQRVLPGVVYQIHYERVVDDIENEARQLLEFCGLDWDDECLRFYANPEASTTASATQVRKPIYRSSLDRWTKYREFLQPLQRILNEAGIDTAMTEKSA